MLPRLLFIGGIAQNGGKKSCIMTVSRADREGRGGKDMDMYRAGEGIYRWGNVTGFPESG